ncbi:Down syndrome cell adhesion molecule-like protein Dscam2 isoform X3 [Zootermopsis nevadensis]|uniref:Down syndrome cell adhesion molecule-like protein Dscam2 isoform X3 n=1 Tax=Zootermopsis nevadensis TaxID=136037 RepID=UPI000B8E9AA0|nr:Down syndrome cell adhesion molecule-like protein Dscam2 isoform X3 [Zootermopsis nevadensis]
MTFLHFNLMPSTACLVRRQDGDPNRMGWRFSTKLVLHLYVILELNVFSHIGVSGLMDGQGPLLVLEPPPRLEFSNSTGSRLDCTARGSPMPSVHWLLADGTPANSISGLRYQLPNGSLSFPAFSAAEFRPDVHRAVYRCVASNALGRVLSRDVRLRAVVMQDFSVGATGSSVSRGNMAVLRCLVPSFVRDFVSVTSWLQDQKFNIYPSSDGDGKFHMLPSGELVVLNAASADSFSSYQCRVTHRLTGETRPSTGVARITVTEARAVTPPQFTDRSISIEVRRDELVVLPCIARGHPPPDYRWEVGGSPLPEPGDEQRYTTGGGGLFVLPRPRPHDSGRYICIASNSAGSSRMEVNLLVTSPLTARVSPGLHTAALGQPARFSCTTAGHPVVSVLWFKDGQPISGLAVQPGMTREMLHLPSVTRDDQGMYQCFVKNEQDVAQGTAELRLGDTPPQLVYRFIEQTIQPGPEVSLKCVASGNPTPNIKWTLDGFPLQRSDHNRFYVGQYELMHGGDVISHVNITSVRVEDGGTYQCMASNRVGEISHAARLNVYGSPYIRVMGEISAVAGVTLRVTCPVAGYPIDSIKWYRGDRLLPINRRHLVFSNGTLVIEKVQSGVDGGSYRCEASNKQGSTARGTAQITVMVPPNITPFSFRLDLHLGERVGVQCVVSKGDSPLTIHWLKDGEQLRQGDGLVLRTLDEFTSVLSIGALAPEHGGNYTCVARNTAAQAAYSAPLSVNVPPTWVVEPQSRAAKLGHQALLDCKVEGFPQPTVAWKKASGEKPGQYQEVLGHQLARLLPNGSLLIESVAQEDEGHYMCEASNGIGVGLSAVVKLTVQAPVHFKVRSRKELVRRGSSALLRCQALGDLPISLSWRKEGSFVELQGRISIKNTSVPEGLVSELTIGAVRTEDGGIYTCFARNEFGHDQIAMHLLVQDAPAPPTDLTIKDSGSRRVTINWVPPVLDGNSPIVRYLVRYSPTQDSWQGPSQEVIVDGTESKATLDELRPAATYSVHVVAENTLGPGSASLELRVRTDEEAPAVAPRRVAVEAVSSTQLALSWEPPPEDQWNGILRGHYVGHRELREVERKNGYNFSEVPWQLDGKGQLRLDGLKKYCKYGIVVQAFNGRGSGPMSPEVVAQTLEDVPEASPRDVRCTALSSDKLQVSWQPPPESLVHGVIQGYRLLYEPVPSPRLTSDGRDILGPQTKMTKALTAVLHDLLKFTNYSVELLAFTRVGDGVKSRRIFCRTKEDVPDAPGGIKVLLETPDTALLTWLPPSNPNGVVVQYNVYVRVLEGTVQLDTRTIPYYSTSQLQYQLPGLKRRQIYEFWVTASTRVGEGTSTPVARLTASAKVSAGIASFGGLRHVTWRSDARLECRAVGVPEPQRQWLVVDTPFARLHPSHQARLALATDGALLLSSAQRSDQGDYTCVVSNEHGRDHITYHLLVQVSPAAPLLIATGSTQHSLQLQWKLGDDGGSPVRGYVIHYKLEHGEWEETHVDGNRNTFALSSLRCGTAYHIFITAYNDVGSGAPSLTLTARTRGGIPAIPPPGDLLVVNSTAALLRLDNWPDSGCSMLYYVVEYMTQKGSGPSGQAKDWVVVGNNIVPGKVFSLVDLSPGSQYRLRVTAHNAAGSNVANYRFTTVTAIGGTAGPSLVMMETETELKAPLHKDMKLIILAVCSAVALCLSLLGLCFCLKRKSGSNRTSPCPSLQDVQTSATQDNKHNLARREQYYATVRKLPPSPATLECIPEYSEDIRPYATFHVPGPPNSETTKLQTFVYRDSDASPTRKSVGKSDYCRVKRPRPGEEYDSFGSESDTEPGTSSRTESSNQLDDGGNQGELNRPYHPAISRLPKSMVDSTYPGSDWSPPPEAVFQRRYCQAHLLK